MLMKIPNNFFRKSLKNNGHHASDKTHVLDRIAYMKKALVENVDIPSEARPENVDKRALVFVTQQEAIKPRIL